MKKSNYSHYMSGGSNAPILWYASLPYHVRRLYDCKSSISQDPTLMVVSAEVVCEAFTVWALGEMFKKKGLTQRWKKVSHGTQWRRFQDISNPNTNLLYTALTGDRIEQASFWSNLQEHIKRRNKLVHPDDPLATSTPPPSREEAEKSFKAVGDYIQHVTTILDSM